MLWCRMEIQHLTQLAVQNAELEMKSYSTLIEVGHTSDNLRKGARGPAQDNIKGTLNQNNNFLSRHARFYVKSYRVTQIS